MLAPKCGKRAQSPPPRQVLISRSADVLPCHITASIKSQRDSPASAGGTHMQDASHLILNNHLGVSKHMLWCLLSINRDTAVCPGLESKTANDERLFYICLVNRRAKSGPLCVRRVVWCVCLHLHKSRWQRRIESQRSSGVSTLYSQGSASGRLPQLHCSIYRPLMTQSTVESLLGI